ncbi:MAG: hypothetical protein FWG67_06355 [Defluviitaleaceae bacterium]|nr:hypothetical protein [Defluviitaleaceae bacterium]
MKNITLKLFEYLSAAQHSDLSVHYNLNNYPAYWFLDEILSFGQLEHVAGKRTVIQLRRPILKDQEIEISASLAAILNLLQQGYAESEHVLISKDELEKTLRLEIDAIKRKLKDENKSTVILNDWQQLLLHVDQSRISSDVAFKRTENLTHVSEQLVREYQKWQTEVKQKSVAQRQLLKEEALYDQLLALSAEADSSNKLYVGMGVLHLPGEPSVYHPLLTMGVELVVDTMQDVCELVFDMQDLVIDAIFEQVLLDQAKVVQDMQPQIDAIKRDPFNDAVMATFLKQVVTSIHAEGRYFSSPVDAVLDFGHVPQVLHRSVLFVREAHGLGDEKKLKRVIEHLSKGHLPSDVLASIGDPHFTARGQYQSQHMQGDQLNPLFAWESDGPEQQILSHLNTHAAVAVFESDQHVKFSVIAHLITYSLATKQRLLIVSEDENELAEIQALLPAYLQGVHHQMPAKRADYQLLKEQLMLLYQKKENYTLSQFEADKVIAEFERVKNSLQATLNQAVDDRQLNSDKVFWKDKAYRPYELAQLVSTLGQKSQWVIDLIPLTMRFEVEASEINRIWELKPYFTPENLALLNYDFINLNELNDDVEYQQMLRLEAAYLASHQVVGDQFQELFDAQTDIRFVQYVFDQLPKLMTAVSSVVTAYGKDIFKKALVDAAYHHLLTIALSELDEASNPFENAQASTDEKKSYLQQLNQLFDVSSADLMALGIQDEAQLVEFYDQRKSDMVGALQAAQLILIFNENSKALSSAFKGVLGEDMVMMDGLYQAAALRLRQVEFEIYWFRVKARFMRIYQPLLHKPHLHPLCLALYGALQHESIDEFKRILNEITALMIKRQNFITFGAFIDDMRVMMPNFTAFVMSEAHASLTTVPHFKAAFEQGQLTYFLTQLQAYEAEPLDQALDQLKNQLLGLQHEMLEIESWKNLQAVDQAALMATIQLLEEAFPACEKVNEHLLLLSQAVFMPLNAHQTFKLTDPPLFDLVIFTDASRANLMRISDLMHGHKVIVFGNEVEKPLRPLKFQREDADKLVQQYGETFHHFGESYFEGSLFNLMIHSAAWEAQVTLPTGLSSAVSTKKETVATGAGKCETVVQEALFDALTKMGYDVKCQVEIGSMMVDFLIRGESTVLGINIVGDQPLEREVLKLQIEREISLRRSGIAIQTIRAVQFYLSSRKVLMDLCANLEGLEIYPLKK